MRDVTFRQAAGLANSSWTSFQSYSHPDRYIRTTATCSGSTRSPIPDTRSRADATFCVTS
ncbi:AbfB domain-containing protein [Micromonospora taraxaci]